MQLSAKRGVDLGMTARLIDGRRRQIRLERGVADVVRLGRGEPIVLVPGLAGGWKLLAPLAKKLAKHNEVILYGLRGDRHWFGAPKAGSIAELGDDLAYLLDALRLERPTVFGVSFGGAVALELAIRHRGRLGGLIVQGIEARFAARAAAKVARGVLDRYPLPSDNRFVNQFFNLLYAAAPEPGPLVDFVVERCWETDQSVMAHRLGLLERFDATGRLGAIDAPTLVLAGGRDAIVAPSRQRALAGSIRGAVFHEVEGAGHVGFLTHRAEVARHVAAFVASR